MIFSCNNLIKWKSISDHALIMKMVAKPTCYFNEIFYVSHETGERCFSHFLHASIEYRGQENSTNSICCQTSQCMEKIILFINSIITRGSSGINRLPVHRI